MQGITENIEGAGKMGGGLKERKKRKQKRKRWGLAVKAKILKDKVHKCN